MDEDYQLAGLLLAAATVVIALLQLILQWQQAPWQNPRPPWPRHNPGYGSPAGKHDGGRIDWSSTFRPTYRLLVVLVGASLVLASLFVWTFVKAESDGFSDVIVLADVKASAGVEGPLGTYASIGRGIALLVLAVSTIASWLPRHAGFDVPIWVSAVLALGFFVWHVAAMLMTLQVGMTTIEVRPEPGAVVGAAGWLVIAVAQVWEDP